MTPFAHLPPAPPPGPWGDLVGWAMTRGRAAFELEALFADMRRPGRPGARTALGLLAGMPDRLWPSLVLEAHRRGVTRPALQVLLCWCWGPRSWKLVEAAGRERLVEIFKDARLGECEIPRMARHIGPVPPGPEPWVLYRGGRGTPAEVAAGWSWSPHKRWAATFAVETWRKWGHAGAPVVVRRRAARADALLYWSPPMNEVVMEPPGDGAWEADGADEAGLVALSEAVRDEKLAMEARGRVVHRPVPLDSEELWEGWDG